MSVLKNFESRGRGDLKRQGQYPRDCYDTEDEKELIFGNRQGRIKNKKIQGNTALMALEAEYNPHTDRGKFVYNMLPYLQGNYHKISPVSWKNLKEQIHFYSVPVLADRVLFRGSAIPNDIFNEIKKALYSKEKYGLRSLSKQLLHGERGTVGKPGYNPGICSSTTDRKVALRFINWSENKKVKTNIFIIMQPDTVKPPRGISLSRSEVGKPEHEVILDGASNHYRITAICGAKMSELVSPNFIKNFKAKGESGQEAFKEGVTNFINGAATMFSFGRIKEALIDTTGDDYCQVIMMKAEDVSRRPHETAEDTHAYAETLIESKKSNPQMYEKVQMLKTAPEQAEKKEREQDKAIDEFIKEFEEQQKQIASIKKHLADKPVKEAAKKKAEEEARKKAEEEARRRAEEEAARRRAEQATRRRAEEAERRRAEDAAMRRQEEVARQREEEAERYRQQQSLLDEMIHIVGNEIQRREAEEREQRNAAIRERQRQQDIVAQYNFSVQQQERQQALAAQYNAAVQQQQNAAAQRQFQQRQMYMQQMFNAANLGNAQMQFGFNSFMPPRGPFGGPPFGGAPF